MFKCLSLLIDLNLCFSPELLLSEYDCWFYAKFIFTIFNELAIDCSLV